MRRGLGLANKVQCWGSINYNEPQTQKYPIDENNNKYSSLLYFTEYDCYNRTSRDLEFTDYFEKDRGGSVVQSGSLTSSSPSRIRPGSVAEALMEFACKQ